MASVMLRGIEDFIAPGQACINPLFTMSEGERAAETAAECENGDKTPKRFDIFPPLLCGMLRRSRCVQIFL